MNEKTYIEELKKYKKEFNDYLIEVKNEMLNYNETLDTSTWLTLGSRSSKLFNLIDKIKMYENKIQEELENDKILKNYELINKVSREKEAFIDVLNNVDLFRNEEDSKSFTDTLQSLNARYASSDEENALEIRQKQREERINKELNSLIRYKNIEDAINELNNLENNGKYNYSIFQNIKESFYIVASSLFWEHLSRSENFQLIDYDNENY